MSTVIHDLEMAEVLRRIEGDMPVRPSELGPVVADKYASIGDDFMPYLSDKGQEALRWFRVGRQAERDDSEGVVRS